MYEIVVPGCASSALTSVTTLVTITAMPELSKVAVIVGLAEVQIHQTALAPNLDQLRSTEDVLQVLSANKSSEYFRYTRKKYVNPTPSASPTIRPLIHILLLYSSKGLLISSRRVKHSVHLCDNIQYIATEHPENIVCAPKLASRPHSIRTK